MSNYIDTQTEGKLNADTNESQLVIWLRDNNLNEAISIFEKENISFNELLSMGEDVSFLRQYLIDLQIAKPLCTRIVFKINKMLKNRDNDNNVKKKQHIILIQSQKPVHIIISEEEDEAINNLKEYKNELTLSLQQLLQEKNQLLADEKKIKSEINLKFNNLINIINTKQKQVLRDLSNMTSKFKSDINAKSEQISQKKEIVINTMKACEHMINQNIMDRNERKKEILSMTNDILKQKEEKELNEYVIDFSFNQTAVSSVIVFFFF